MKPFALRKHDQDFAAIRELREDEMNQVSGGIGQPVRDEIDPGDYHIKLNTVTLTPDADGGDDQADEN